MGSAANSKVQNARDDALGAERIRQQGFDKETAAINTKSQDNYKTFGTDQAADATKLGDYFANQQAQPASAEAALPTTASNVTVNEMNKQAAKSKDFTDKSGAALGTLRSFGDILGSKGFDTARDTGYIGQIGGFKQGSNAVLPYELDDASHAGDGLKTFGDLVGGAGQLGVSAGLSGKSVSSLFGGVPASNVVTKGSMAAARIADRASVPGYAGISTRYGGI